MNFFQKKVGYFDLIILFIIIYLFYNFAFTIPTDIQLHAQLIVDYIDNKKPFQVNFFYYFTVYLFSFFSSNLDTLLVISVYILSTAVFAKFYLVKRLFIKHINFLSVTRASIYSAILIFCFSIPILFFFTDFYYLLNFPPNVWHNSTTIFVMPFVIMLFWLSIEQIENYNKKRLLLMSLLILINVIIKPSFLFVYVIVYPLFLLKKYKLNDPLFWINLTPIIFCFILIFLEYFLIFKIIGNTNKNSSVVIDFFHFFKLFSNNFNVFFIFIISLLSSLLYPIFLIIVKKNVLKKTHFSFSLLSMIVSIILSITLSETGDRENDGNFLWQAIICSFLLFFSSTFELLSNTTSDNKMELKKFYPVFAILFLHFISGIVYFIYIFTSNVYF